MVTYPKEDSDVSHLNLHDHDSENKPLRIHKQDNSKQTNEARRPLQNFAWVSFYSNRKNIRKC